MKKTFVQFLLMSCLFNQCHATEYGVFLLPDQESRHQVKALVTNLKGTFTQNNITYEEVPNTPHLSIFQGVIKEDNLDALKEGVRALALQNPSSLPLEIDPDLQDTEENIFLNLKNGRSVIPLMEAFYDFRLHQLRAPDLLMAQVERDIAGGITPEAKAFINEYGLYWGIPGKYNPHFTLIYGSYKNVHIQEALANTNVDFNTLTLTSIAIGLLGFDGNVTEVIESYPL